MREEKEAERKVKPSPNDAPADFGPMDGKMWPNLCVDNCCQQSQWEGGLSGLEGLSSSVDRFARRGLGLGRICVCKLMGDGLLNNWFY